MLVAGALALRSPSLMTRTYPCMDAFATRVASYEQCILDALSEDDVAACMSSFDETRFDLDDQGDAVEQCILDAKSEDEVQECMRMADEGKFANYKVDVSPAVSALGQCIAVSGDVEMCIAEADNVNEHSYG